MELTSQDYLALSDELKTRLVFIPQAATKALVDVLSLNDGFLSNDSCVIKFERNMFYYCLSSNKTESEMKTLKYSFPNIITERPSEYSTVEDDYRSLAIAKSINEECALMSTRWGMFQLLGSNYRQCGYIDPVSFVNDMRQSRKKQLAILGYYIKSNVLLCSALDYLDWNDFIEVYSRSNVVKENAVSLLERQYKVRTSMP
jgi:hypothetical protein